MDVPTCPEWWPLMLWKLHIPRGPIIDIPHGGPGPVNFPASIDHIMSAMVIHTSSYLLQDKEAAALIRETSVKTIVNMAQQMGELHDQAVKQSGII